MHRHLVGFALPMLLLAGAGLFGQSPSAMAAAHSVSVADFAFTDAASSTSTTTISAGESVTWTWSGGMHSVTADDASFDSDPPAGTRTSGTYVRTFATAGTYAYYCRLHGGPGGVGMSGTIVVQAAAPTSTSTSVATSTPVTPSATARSTGTPIATNTPALTPSTTPPAFASPAAVASPAAASPPVAPPQPDAATQLPRTGTGEDRGVTYPWLTIAVALLGGAALIGALVARRRA